MARIKIEGDFFGEESYENNYALEYLKRELNDHAESNVLDHPDGSVTKEKLSAEIRDTLTLNSSGITNHEVRVKKLENESHTHTNKDVLDTITSEKTDKWDSYENTISKEKTANAQKFSELEDLLSTKADRSETDSKLEAKANKSDVLTKTETYTIVSDVLGNNIQELDRKKADKAVVQTLREDITIASEHIRNHDTDIRNLGEGKADKADTYTKSEVDTSIETIRMMAGQATNEANIAYSLSRQNETDITELQSDVSLLEASQGWKLIAETKLTQEEFDAANGEVTAIVLDLGKKIESADEWYSETMIRVEIPKCKALGSNASISTGKLRVMFGNTPQQATGKSGSLPIAVSQSNNNLVTPSKDKEQGYVITSVWRDRENIDYSYIGFRTEGASNGYVNTPYFAYVKDMSNATRSIIGRQYLGLYCFYSVYVDGEEQKTLCVFPVGTKMALYGRV